jgi:amino acid transporter
MKEVIRLRRRLTLPLVTLYGLGTILGAGIYVLVGKVAGKAGLYAPLSFLLAAAVAALTAFSYAQLSSRFPVSAGEARYVRHAFGSRALAGVVGWSIVFIGVTSAATMALGFAGYLQIFLNLDTGLIVSFLILLFGALALWGILESVGIISLITIIEISGLFLVMGLNIPSYAGTPELLSQWDGLDTAIVWNGIILGSILAFYAFLGFEDIVNVAEEVVDPGRNLPRGIYLSLIVSGLLYMLISLLSVLVLPLEQLAASEAPMADMMSSSSWSRHSISVISMLAISNGALIQIIMASRMIYGLAGQGNAPAAFRNVNVYTHTPHYATILICFFVWVFALWLPLITLAQITSVITLFVFTLVNLSLLKENLSHFRNGESRAVDMIIPLSGALTCLFLLGYQIIWGF